MALVTEGTKLVVKHPAPKSCLWRSHKSWIEIEFGFGVCTDKNRKFPTISSGTDHYAVEKLWQKKEAKFVEVYRALNGDQWCHQICNTSQPLLVIIMAIMAWYSRLCQGGQYHVLSQAPPRLENDAVKSVTPALPVTLQNCNTLTLQLCNTHKPCHTLIQWACTTLNSRL